MHFFWKQNVVANHSLAMSRWSYWKYSGICSWERGGGEVITFTYDFEHCSMKFVAALPCLGLSAFLFCTDNCVVSDHLLSWELSPTTLSRNPRQIQQHCFQCQERPEQWPSAGYHWAGWCGNVLIAVWHYGLSCQLLSKAAFSGNKALLIPKCLLQWELSRV